MVCQVQPQGDIRFRKGVWESAIEFGFYHDCLLLIIAHIGMDALSNTYLIVNGSYFVVFMIIRQFDDLNEFLLDTVGTQHCKYGFIYSNITVMVVCNGTKQIKENIQLLEYHSHKI